MEETVLTWGNYGYITIPQILGVTHWFIIPLFVIGSMALFRWFEKEGLSLSIRFKRGFVGVYANFVSGLEEATTKVDGFFMKEE